MPSGKYVYLKKQEDRQDFQAQFMINGKLWEEFKKVCEESGFKRSEKMREFIKSYLNKNKEEDIVLVRK